MQQSPEAIFIENLVDRIKQTGTLVYDHTDPLNPPLAAVAKPCPTTTGPDSPNSKPEPPEPKQQELNPTATNSAELAVSVSPIRER